MVIRSSNIIIKDLPVAIKHKLVTINKDINSFILLKVYLLYIIYYHISKIIKRTLLTQLRSVNGEQFGF